MPAPDQVRITPVSIGAGATSPGSREPRVRSVPLIDLTILEEIIGPDPTGLRSFLTEFLHVSRGLKLELRAAYVAGDARAVQRITHNLKVDCRAVGALALGELCARLERDAKSEDWTAMAESIAVFEPLVTKVGEAVSRFLSEA